MPALAVAWLVLLGAATAAATYVALARQSAGPVAPPAVANLVIQAPPPELLGAGPAGETPAAQISPTAAEAGIQEPVPAPEGGPETTESEVAVVQAPEAELAKPPDAAVEAEAVTMADGGAPALAPQPASVVRVIPQAPEPPDAVSEPGPETALAEPGARPPWQRYAARYPPPDNHPRIAVILTGLGLSARTTTAAIRDLPATVTLSFTPYSPRLQQWVAMARGHGHEVMLDLPMEPITYPDDDPGPQTLLTQLDEAENRARLSWVLGRADGYVGLAASMGSRFAGSESHLMPILQEIRDKGLMFLDNRASEDSVAARVARALRLPHAVNDRLLDDGQASHVTIDARLSQVERLALTDGSSVTMAQPSPATIERLSEWLRTLDSRGFTLVPVTALAQTAL